MIEYKKKRRCCQEIDDGDATAIQSYFSRYKLDLNCILANLDKETIAIYLTVLHGILILRVDRKRLLEEDVDIDP